jgi:hypothetical protein
VRWEGKVWKEERVLLVDIVHSVLYAVKGVEVLPWMLGHKKQFVVCGRCWFVILRIKRRRGWGFV